MALVPNKHVALVAMLLFFTVSSTTAGRFTVSGNEFDRADVPPSDFGTGDKTLIKQKEGRMLETMSVTLEISDPEHLMKANVLAMDYTPERMRMPIHN